VGKRYSEVADEVLDLGLKEYAKKYNVDLEKYKWGRWRKYSGGGQGSACHGVVNSRKPFHHRFGRKIPSPPGGLRPHTFIVFVWNNYNSSFISLFSFYLQRKGSGELTSLRRGWILPLYSKYSFVKISLNDAEDVLPWLDWGLSGTVGGATSISHFLQGTRA